MHDHGKSQRTKTVKFWDLKSGKIIHDIDAHDDEVNVVEFNNNDSFIVSGSIDGRLKFWDASSARLLNAIDYGGRTSIKSLAIMKNNNTLIALNSDSIDFWNINLPAPQYKISQCCHDIYSVTASKNNEMLAFGSADGVVRVFDSRLKKSLSAFENKFTSVFSTNFSPDNKVLAAGFGNGKILLWDLKTNKLLHELNSYGAARSLIFSSGNDLLMAGGEDGVLRFWKVSEGTIAKEIKAHDAEITSIDLSRSGELIATADMDGNIRLWDFNSGKLLFFLKHDVSDWIFNIKFDKHSDRLASVSRKVANIWDIKNKTKVTSFENTESSDFRDINFYGDSLVITDLENGLSLWSISEKTRLNYFSRENIGKSLGGFSNAILNGKIIATGGAKRTIKLFDMKAGKIVSELYLGGNGDWLSLIGNTFYRGDNEGFMLLANNDEYTVAPPLSQKNASNGTVEIDYKKTPIQVAYNKTTPIKLRLKNMQNTPVFWIRPQTDIGSIFSISDDWIYSLKPHEVRDVEIKVNISGKVSPKSKVELLQFDMMASGKLIEKVKIPVNILTPNVKIDHARLQNDQKTLNISVRNTGSSPINGLAFNLRVNGKNKLAEQLANDFLTPDQSSEKAFVVPNSLKLDKDSKINLDVRTTTLPLLIWRFDDYRLSIGDPYYGVYIAFLLLLIFGLMTYILFYRYRHPLVRELSAQSQALYHLPLEQLPEAQQRLQQTRRLSTVLDNAEVSRDTLKQAIDFQQASAEQKAQMLEMRLGGRLEEGRMQYAPTEDDTRRGVLHTPSSEVFSLKLPPTFPLNADRLLLYFPTADAQDAFTHLQAIPQAEGRITLIIGPDSAYQRKLLNTTQDLSNKVVAPQSRQLTDLLLNPHAEAALTSIMSEQLSLKQISPYQIGGGVNKETIFFGRRELIAQIVNRDPANYLLVGGRQMGKSTLLKALERRYADNPHVQCHYHTLSNEVMVPRLASALQLPHTDDTETFAAALEQRIRDTGQRYIFLIDEADRFIEHEQARGYPILNVFRRLSEQGHCSFILAGFWQLYQHAVLDYQSPLRNFGEVLEIGALEYDACHQLATDPMQKMNVGYASDAIVQDMIEKCGQRANLIAYVCHQLIQNLPAQQRTMEAGDIHRVLDSRDMSKRLEGWVVGISEQEQRYDRLVVYATIGKQSFSTGELIQQLEEQNLTFDATELERTLSRLELAFVLGRASNRWHYCVPLFVDYLRADEPEVKLATVLKQW